MPDLGNAWHIPNRADRLLRGRGAMRDPLGALVPGTAITIFSGNQFQGGGNSGNQLETGSSVFFKREVTPNWTELPMKFFRTAGNNKYYAATIPANSFQTADVVQYYLRIAYDDHETTYLQATANGDTSTPTNDEAAARATPFTFTVQSHAICGQWGPVFALPNVAIHTHVLPTGKILMWGRRKDPTSRVFETLNEHECFPFIWDPDDPNRENSTSVPQPKLADGNRVNLFCAGHAFLADGRLIVVGGHLFDSQGANQATIYDPATNTWHPLPSMPNAHGDPDQGGGRWYPTALTMPNGTVLVSSGSFPTGPLQPPDNGNAINNVSTEWTGAEWRNIADFNQDGRGSLQLYPRMHVGPDGRVFMSGGLPDSFFLDTETGDWIKSATREAGAREYTPAVLYDTGKILFIGGGLDRGSLAPTNVVEKIDLNKQHVKWEPTSSMNFARRQHNAVLLPDGSVLVVGGTQGNGFNNLDPGQPVHTAERWDPKTEQWTEMAAEEVDRCYHSTAVLLPDATVLSAGGGEYAPTKNVVNDPMDSHPNAQIFSPPYLFRSDGTLAARPDITSAPEHVIYGQAFNVGTSQPNQIAKVTWIRLPSVTHAFDQSQRINILNSKVSGGVLQVTAPANAEFCPPGPYMLFVLNRDNVPSVAKIVMINHSLAPAALAPIALATAMAPSAQRLSLTFLMPQEKAEKIARDAKFLPVTVGVTATCPYGLSACWGGAHHALLHLKDVDVVSPIADSSSSTATVYLNHGGLPDIDVWPEQFAETAKGSHFFRGVEVTLTGKLETVGEFVIVTGNDVRPDVSLAPLQAGDKIQWNRETESPWPPTPEELSAYDELKEAFRNTLGLFSARVTGPLKKISTGGFVLEVREFAVEAT